MKGREFNSRGTTLFGRKAQLKPITAATGWLGAHAFIPALPGGFHYCPVAGSQLTRLSGKQATNYYPDHYFSASYISGYTITINMFRQA
jgi:hypothetical protein